MIFKALQDLAPGHTSNFISCFFIFFFFSFYLSLSAISALPEHHTWFAQASGFFHLLFLFLESFPPIYLMPCFFIQTLFKWSFLKEAAADHLSKVIPFSLLTGLILLYFSLLTFITGLKQGIYLFTYLSPFSIIWLH